MNLPDGLIPSAWYAAAWPVLVALLAAAMKYAPWKRLRAPGDQHVYAGSVVAMMVLWSVVGSVGPGLSFHLLGTTILTLMFGPALALVAALLALAGVTLAGLAGWHAFAVNALLTGALPIAVSHGVYRLVDTRLPNHFFVYVFLAAFLNGGLAMGASGVAGVTMLWAAGLRSGAYLFGEFLPFYILLAWAEALLTGMLMTILVVYKPAWVGSFDDRRYLLGR